MFSKDYNVFIYISKTSMSSIIDAFKRLQCFHLHFKDFNVFNHLNFQKTTMSSFTLSKDYNVFIYKTSMSSVIYAFKRLQCLRLYFKDLNVFNHLCFQKTTMSSFTFQRLQCLQSFTLSKDYNVFIYISKTSMSLVIYAFKRLQCLHLHFKDFNVFSYLRFQKTTMSSFTFQRLQCLQLFTLSKDYNVFIYKTSMSSVIYAFKRLQCLHLHFKDFNVFNH